MEEWSILSEGPDEGHQMAGWTLCSRAGVVLMCRDAYGFWNVQVTWGSQEEEQSSAVGGRENSFLRLFVTVWV